LYTPARTDARGIASISAPTAYDVSFVASKPGMTTEWLLNAPPANGTSLTITLYPHQVNLSWQGTFMQGANPDPWCDFQLVKFPNHQKDFQQRMTDIQATLAWTNGVPQGMGDYDLGYALGNDYRQDVYGDGCPNNGIRVAGHPSLGPQ